MSNFATLKKSSGSLDRLAKELDKMNSTTLGVGAETTTFFS